MTTTRLLLVSGLLGLSLATAAHAQAPTPKPPAPAASVPAASGKADKRSLDVGTKAWKGDFDGMLERRSIRFYVPYSRSLYFIDKGRERGISADLIREFERWVNKKHAAELGKRPLTAVVIVDHTRQAARRSSRRARRCRGRQHQGPPERLKDVDFVAPDEKAAGVEILVTGPATPAIATIDDLSGKTVHLREVSS